MFSDAHFHLQHSVERGVDMSYVLKNMAIRDCFFALDIGTHCDDLDSRLDYACHAIDGVGDSVLEQKVADMLYFSAGIWPAAEAVDNRSAQVAELARRIERFFSLKAGEFCAGHLCAVGECGLDHHWNPSGADSRSWDDFSTCDMLTGEAELFEMQLELARRFALPVIVHSRDAFDGTLACIRNIGYDKGVIHCYSYGVAEARAFLDRGWYISFSGSVTYAKKSRLPEMQELIRYVPQDRMLIETDSPYLAPVPYRGQVNSPMLVEFVYRFVAESLAVSVEELSSIVDENITQLFGVKSFAGE